ncbi:hypothetical protein LZ30DRAFT_239140 [Colletotrichum cereale]|nr:hypothetical protein LZ30DRAFT_239140 [Colletotrichum cereale]
MTECRSHGKVKMGKRSLSRLSSCQKGPTLPGQAECSIPAHLDATKSQLLRTLRPIAKPQVNAPKADSNRARICKSEVSRRPLAELLESAGSKSPTLLYVLALSAQASCPPRDLHGQKSEAPSRGPFTAGIGLLCRCLLGRPLLDAQGGHALTTSDETTLEAKSADCGPHTHTHTHTHRERERFILESPMRHHRMTVAAYLSIRPRMTHAVVSVRAEDGIDMCCFVSTEVFAWLHLIRAPLSPLRVPQYSSAGKLEQEALRVTVSNVFRRLLEFPSTACNCVVIVNPERQ